MKFKWLIIALIGLLSAVNVIADEDVESPFPIETRCLPEAVQPNSSWSYSGTLLMAGYAGIHAMQSDWETPKVEAFFNSGALGEPHEGGQLSPNGQWYAVPLGETWVEPSFNQYWATYGLRIYSTSDETEINIAFSDYDSLLDYPRMGYYMTAWTYEAVRWVDDETVAASSFLIKPFGDEIEVEVAPIPVALNISYDFEVSPDWSRAYGYIAESENSRGIFDPQVPDAPIASFYTRGLAWSPDSSLFVAQQEFEENEGLSLFDRDGNFLEQLFVSEGRIDVRRLISGRNELSWSPDSSKFVFLDYLPYPNLMILDLENKVAIDTCLSPVSQAVWSPDGKQMALLLNARENLKVAIIDLETWTVYDVARHSGRWGSLRPEMLAWRSND